MSEFFVFGAWESGKAFPNEKDSIGRMEKRSLTKKESVGVLPREKNNKSASWECSHEEKKKKAVLGSAPMRRKRKPLLWFNSGYKLLLT